MSSLGGQLGVGLTGGLAGGLAGGLTPPFAIPAGQPAVQAAVQATAVPPSASTSPGLGVAGAAPGKARSSMNLSMISGRWVIISGVAEPSPSLPQPPPDQNETTEL